jgi:hypothetical protein
VLEIEDRNQRCVIKENVDGWMMCNYGGGKVKQQQGRKGRLSGARAS